MKFLGWMHCKLMHNNKSTVGNIPACFSAQTLFDEQKNNKTTTCSSIKCLRSPNEREVNFFREMSPEPFDFLAIGTFGMELIIDTDPPTPTLATPFEKWTKPRNEITENDLVIANSEPEKFLEAEEKDTADGTSGWSTRASVINLGRYRPSEEPIGEEGKKEKLSLDAGLYEEKNIDYADDDTKGSDEGAEQEPRKKNVPSFMKEVAKKFRSPSKAGSKNDDALSISIKRNLSKAIKMFRRKVHPDVMPQKQFAKLQKNGKIELCHDDARPIRGRGDENEMNDQDGTVRVFSNNADGNPSTNKGEHWIKTDSDYLVLEL